MSDQKPSTPAPLSADSLRESVLKLKLNYQIYSATFFEHDVMELIATALQSQRQRIADSLPEKRHPIYADMPSNEQVHGFNEAIEAVRAVLTKGEA